MSMLNCTRETKLCTILMVMPSKKKINKPVSVTIEQLDQIPEIAAALPIRQQYLDMGKDDKANEVMEFLAERIQKFMFAAIYPESNSVQLCHDQLGLPDYEGMDKLIEEQLALEQVH